MELRALTNKFYYYKKLILSAFDSFHFITELFQLKASRKIASYGSRLYIKLRFSVLCHLFAWFQEMSSRVKKLKNYNYSKSFQEILSEHLSQSAPRSIQGDNRSEISMASLRRQTSDFYFDDEEESIAEQFAIRGQGKKEILDSSTSNNTSKNKANKKQKVEKKEKGKKELNSCSEERMTNAEGKQEISAHNGSNSRSDFDEENEQFIIEFDHQPVNEDDPAEVFRSSYLYNNDYIKIEVYLDDKKKMMEQRVRKIYARNNPDYIQEPPCVPAPPQSQILKRQQNGVREPIRYSRGRRRNVLTMRGLNLIRLLFRQYQHQQKFSGTPFYKKRLSLRSIAEGTGVSLTEIKYLFEEFATDPLFTMRFSTMDESQGSHNAVAQQMEEIRLKFIEQMVGRNCVLTQQEIADEMNQCQDLLTRDHNGHLQPITRKLVQELLRKGNYSRKKVQLVPKNRNSPQTVENRFHYCKQYLELLTIPNAEIYFLDESRFNMMTVRDRGWAKKGMPATKSCVNSKGKDIILLALISITGLVWFELSDGYNAAAFTISMDGLGKLLTSEKGPNDHRYIIMDNCPIHNKQNLKNIQDGHNLKFIYLPPYTPMLNPIEYWFNELKSNVRQKTYKTRTEMKNNLQAILSRYKDKSFENYYDCIKPYLELGVRRQLCK